MKNSILTAIVVCEDSIQAQEFAEQLQSDGIRAVANGRAIQATTEFQVVGELPTTAPEGDRSRALIQTLMKEIEEEDKLRESLNALDAPYIILDDNETDTSISIQNMVEGQGVEHLFSAIVEVSKVRNNLTEQFLMAQTLTEHGEDIEQGRKQAEALSTVLSFAKKALALVLSG